eukprot:CAMPEP_0206475410 /NCGR_PEP_ID=MMETSP0324_2-20121206/34059_1 /ASSEMBLY_ACC=CAM_ASM_000836 /TAXON_ID=2866 /ORGANISM="Crypthecodinium cohnii, Strain Seligo" /LENGTH=94 /DNA_ID=CAMNT_0053950755 /DNA_START=89 /DNA_END=370 /DNA_ORIENTATION=+
MGACFSFFSAEARQPTVASTDNNAEAEPKEAGGGDGAAEPLKGNPCIADEGAFACAAMSRTTGEALWFNSHAKPNMGEMLTHAQPSEPRLCSSA